MIKENEMDPQKQPEELPHTPLVQAPPQEPMPPAPGELPQTPKKSHKVFGLILLLGPTAFIIFSIVLYAVLNFIFSGTAQPNADGLFPDPSPIQSILNIFLFLAGAAGVIAWLPGIIVGIILLAKK